MTNTFDHAGEYLEAVRHAFGALADGAGMRVVEYRYDVEACGNALLVLEAKRLRLRIVRARGQNVMWAGPPGDREGRDLGPVLHLCGVRESLPDGRPLADASPRQLAAVIERHRSAIEEVFTPDRAPESRTRLEEIQRERATRLRGGTGRGPAV